MNIKLLANYHLEYLSLKGGCTGSSESIHVKMPHCLKSHVAVHMFSILFCLSFRLATSVLQPVWRSNRLCGYEEPADGQVTWIWFCYIPGRELRGDCTIGAKPYY